MRWLRLVDSAEGLLTSRSVNLGRNAGSTPARRPYICYTPTLNGDWRLLFPLNGVFEMRGIWVLLALILAVGMFPNDAEAGRSGCRSCKSGKAKRQYRLRTRVSTVSKSACSGGSCAAPATKTIEKTKLKTSDHSVYLKAWCKEECRLQAERGQGNAWHPRGTPAGCYFCGTGVGTSSCRPHNGPPKASVTAYGYTTRVW